MSNLTDFIGGSDGGYSLPEAKFSRIYVTSDTFMPPTSGKYLIIISGGGGGGGNVNFSDDRVAFAYGGGAGALKKEVLHLLDSDSIEITIGAGGNNATGIDLATSGGKGGQTSFGNLLVTADIDNGGKAIEGDSTPSAFYPASVYLESILTGETVNSSLLQLRSSLINIYADTENQGAGDGESSLVSNGTTGSAQVGVAAKYGAGGGAHADEYTGAERASGAGGDGFTLIIKLKD